MPRKSVNHTAPTKSHGETFDLSSCTAIRAEDADAIAHIKAALVDFYQPANSEEHFAIERIALARHSLLRTYRLESGLITFGFQKALQIPGVPQILGDPEQTGEPPVTTGQEQSFWMAAGFCFANGQSHWLSFLRYQAQAERLYRRALEEFERLRRHRGRVPEQTVVEPAPEPAAGVPPAPPPPTPKEQFVDPPGVSAAAVPPRRTRAASRPRRPIRTCRVVLGTTVPPAAAKAVRTGSPNAP